MEYCEGVHYCILVPLERKTRHPLPQIIKPNRILNGKIVAEDKVLQRYFLKRFHEEGWFVKYDAQGVLLMYKKDDLHGIIEVRVV